MNVTQNKGLFSFEIGPDGIAVAYAPLPNKREITICEFHPYRAGGSSLKNDDIKACFEEILSQHNLRKTHCSWVLHPDYYRLTLIDVPNVPQSEYKQAVRWQIKDIINYPLEDTVIDIFYPDEPERSSKKVFVIAAQNSFLQSIIDLIQNFDLYPIAVDIREFAIRNLLGPLAKQNETIGFISIVHESCLLVLIKQNNIKFVRRIPIGLKNIAGDNYTDLIAELQRSFNYCQTELKQEMPTKICMPNKITVEPRIKENLGSNIAKNLNIEVSNLDLQKIVTFKTFLSPKLESDCWIAVGGALRNIIV